MSIDLRAIEGLVRLDERRATRAPKYSAAPCPPRFRGSCLASSVAVVTPCVAKVMAYSAGCSATV
jgi:hypothetical protein